MNKQKQTSPWIGPILCISISQPDPYAKLGQITGVRVISP
jgi:hypothetical protein